MKMRGGKAPWGDSSGDHVVSFSAAPERGLAGLQRVDGSSSPFSVKRELEPFSQQLLQHAICSSRLGRASPGVLARISYGRSDPRRATRDRLGTEL